VVLVHWNANRLVRHDLLGGFQAQRVLGVHDLADLPCRDGFGVNEVAFTACDADEEYGQVDHSEFQPQALLLKQPNLSREAGECA
jgi:hypothetical protein